MAVQVATRKKPKAKASPRSGSGSFGYPWGTERPNAVYERLGMAQFAQAEDEIRQVEAEAARRVRQIRMRMDVLDQIKRGVQKCCTVMADGKLRFSRELADAAGPLFDVSMAREVVDLDKRRPGRPSATSNLETQALRAVMRELVHDPAAEYRRRQIEGGVAPDGAGGSECKTRRRPVAIVPLGEVATQVSPLAPAGDIVVLPSVETEVEAALSDEVGDIPDEAEAVAEAEASTLSTLVPEVRGEAVPEVLPEVVEARSPALLASLVRLEEAVIEWDTIDAVKARIRQSTARLTSPAQVDGITSLITAAPTVISRRRFYLPDQEAMRLASMDFVRVPGGVDPTFGDHWSIDPASPPTEIFEEFPGCDLPWDAPYDGLSEDDARRMWGLAINDDADRAYVYPLMKWRQDVKFYRGVPAMFETYASHLELRREEETYRRQAWELVIARRDLIKGLLRMLALDELTLDPASWRLRDRMRSVRYLVFRNSDFMFLLLMNVKLWPAYALRSVDKLSWLEGFDRRSLIADFGGEMDPDVCPPIGAWDRLPLWLLPEVHYYHSLTSTPIDLDEVPFMVPNLKIVPDRSKALSDEAGLNQPFVFDESVDVPLETL